MWAEQLRGLGGRYRVIAPDLRGHGESEAPEGAYTMDTMADDVIELLDRLDVRDPVVVGGLSMGGYVAFSLVLRYPERVRALMILDSRATADTLEAARNREETARSILFEGSSESMIETMVPRLFGKTTLAKHPERVAPILSIMERCSVRGIAGALRGMALRPDRTPELSRIRVPTLVLVGEEDVISPPEEAQQLARMLPDGRVVVVPEAGHLAPFENPTACNEAIMRFLDEISTTRSQQPEQYATS
jgi:pimeloyl-ACP methyl ester carboxylesterase